MPLALSEFEGSKESDQSDDSDTATGAHDAADFQQCGYRLFELKEDVGNEDEVKRFIDQFGSLHARDVAMHYLDIL